MLAVCTGVSAHALDPSLPAAAMKPVMVSIAPPPTPVHDVRNYGAKGDGKTYDTQALQKAVDACAGSGGSVLLSKGTFLTAQLELKGGMTLYIDKDAVLLGGIEPQDYPILSPDDPDRQTVGRYCRRSVLYANQADKLILDGGGTIDGQGAKVKMTGKESERPSLIRIFQSKDVTVRNVVLKNPRMWTQIYDHCQNLTLDNVKVFAPPVCPNLDGMDICDCHDVVIRNCLVDSEDDSICLKSHGKYGLKNVVIENNSIYCYRANAIKIGTATNGPIEDLQILNNTVYFAKYGGLCIESVDGSAMRNVTVRGLDIYNTAQPIFIRLGGRSHRETPGSIHNVLIEKVRVLGTHAQTVPSCTVTGMAGVKLGEVRLKDFYIEMPGGIAKPPKAPKELDGGYPQSNIFGIVPGYGFYVRHAGKVVFEDVAVGHTKADARPWLASDDAAVETLRCKNLKKVTPVAIPPCPWKTGAGK